MLLLGYDIGSSSVKGSVVDSQTGKTVAFASFPSHEAIIMSPRPGWAEQEPDMWWGKLKLGRKPLLISGSLGMAAGAFGVALSNVLALPAWVPVISIMVYSACFMFSWGQSASWLRSSCGRSYPRPKAKPSKT